MSKLTGEHLVRLYLTNYHVPTVALRYLTVYGPQQHPDVAFHRLIRSIKLDRSGVQKGDVDRTEAHICRAKEWLGYEPRTSLTVGLQTEIRWMEQLIAP